MSDLLLAMKTFVRVVERGGLTRAAIDLDVAQASVTRHVQALEARYGVPLIVRGSRPLRLTTAGTRVLDYAQAVLRSEGELAESLRLDEAGLSGRLTVAAPAGFGQIVLAPVAFAFAQAHPGVRLRMAFSERLVNLIEEGVDVAVRIGQARDSSLVRRPLAELEEWLVASPSFVGDGPPLDTPRALDARPRVALTGLQAPAVAHSRTSHVLASPTVLELDNSVALREAVVAGLGYAALHRYLVEEAVAGGRLQRLLPRWTLPRWPLAAYFASRQRPARVDAFVEALATHIKQATSRR